MHTDISRSMVLKVMGRLIGNLEQEYFPRKLNYYVELKYDWLA
jgi:hypothetical protein